MLETLATLPTTTLFVPIVLTFLAFAVSHGRRNLHTVAVPSIPCPELWAVCQFGEVGGEAPRLIRFNGTDVLKRGSRWVPT
jgi:hypothetical protein